MLLEISRKINKTPKLVFYTEHNNEDINIGNDGNGSDGFDGGFSN